MAEHFNALVHYAQDKGEFQFHDFKVQIVSVPKIPSEISTYHDFYTSATLMPSGIEHLKKK